MKQDVNQYRILVIEDNPGDDVLITEFLEEQIHLPEIFHARNFKEGVQLLARELFFNVILLDLSLPDKEGEDLIEGILSVCSGIPIIVLTGYKDMAFSVKSLALGVSDYLLKDDLTSSSLYKSILYSQERRKKSAELEESERRYSDLFQLNPQPMWVYDPDTLQFLNVNAAAIQHYGFSREEFLLMTIRDIRPEEEVLRVEEAEGHVRTKREPFSHGIFKHRKKSGELIQVEIQSSPIQFKGKMAQVVLAIDITERMNYIDAIKMQNEKLQNIAWMQSHVVRAPVARLMGLANLIKNYELSDEERRQLMDQIVVSAEELDAIIRDISEKANQI